MSERALSLATRFEHANDRFIAFAEGLSEGQWVTLCPSEERTVAALAHHVAWGYDAEMEAFGSFARGEESWTPWTREGLDGSNAKLGAEFAECSQAETVALLRHSGARAASAVRALTDEELDRSGTYS